MVSGLLSEDREMIKFFTDDLGEAFALDVSKVDVVTSNYMEYTNGEGERKTGAQIGVGAVWVNVNMEVAELIDFLGLESE